MTTDPHDVARHPARDHQAVLAAKRREGRTNLVRLAEVRGWVGGHRAPHRDIRLRTDDGVDLAATWLPGPQPDATAVVVVHGLAAHRRKPAYAFLADHLAARHHVLAIDLRGHGGSAGVCTLGAQEWRDVHAAVEGLRARGHGRVVVVGLSLGGTATAHALGRGLEVDGAVLLSSSARHGDLSEPGMATLDLLWRSTLRRRTWQALAGFRLAPPEAVAAYPDPAELLAASTVPVLVIHGEDDGYVGMAHAEALRDAAGGPARLWREPVGFGHAEDGLTPAFVERLSRAIWRRRVDGAFPDRVTSSRDPHAG